MSAQLRLKTIAAQRVGRLKTIDQRYLWQSAGISMEPLLFSSAVLQEQPVKHRLNWGVIYACVSRTNSLDLAGFDFTWNFLKQTSFANHGDFRSVSWAITWREVNGLVTRRRVTDLINNWGSPFAVSRR
ncbi:hypothetical protein GHT06_017678 [Daphnia sinensis]|uniref:Uncharacterized protein n=1 Tax=Daphnia sinensis TaxID=1820382 RepID=A0AAD5PRM0_9CRUS|nr:hypothetical protein GHT06_017678 [Daphnia sinensis]